MANPSLQIGNSNWAIKEDNLLGYSTAGTRFVPQPITMTRASAGTRVNSSGLVETVELLGSEEVTNGDFATDGTPSTNTWTLGWYSNTANVSISGGKITLTNSASESSSLAYATNGVSSNNVLITNQLYKLQYQVVANNGVTSFKYYSSAGAFIDAPIDLGVTHTIYIKNTSNQLFLFQNATTNSNISLDNVSIKESTKNNLARVDYDGTASSLLVESERTNTLTYSEDFSQWATSGTTPTLTTGQLSPSGEYNATKISGTIGSSLIYLGGSSSSTTATRTIYARTVSGTGTARLMSRHHNVNNLFTLTEDWTRFELTGSDSLGGGDFYIDMRGTQTLSEFIVWGGQSEVGSYATSYIPTDGGTVTRVQDQYEKTGISNLINSPEGVLFVEASTFENGADCRITLSDGTITNRVSIEWDILANTIKGFVGSDGNLVSPASYNQTDSNKIALKYKVNDCALWINGTEVDTDFSVSALSGVNQLEFSNYGGTVPFEGKVKQLQVFKTALTDTELIALTT